MLQLNDPSLLRTKAFVAGRWVDEPGRGEFPVFNPADETVIASVSDTGRQTVRVAIEAATVAMAEWKLRTAKDRANILRNWFDLILTNTEDLALLMTWEQGKPLAESRAEIRYAASFVEWFAEEGKRAYGDVIPAHATDLRLLTVKQPVGVVAAITPWNFPSAMITRKAAPALAAGCALVIKPAAETPLSALALAELAHRAGLPDGILNIVVGTDAIGMGEELSSHPQVRKLTFTGSTRVGKLLMAQCAGTVKKTSMELGGNAPFIVFDDADLPTAVAGVMASKFRNAGQTCISANRILVQEGIYSDFLQELTRVVKKLKLGDGRDPETDIGPLITGAALDNVDSLVRNALDCGARAMAGGQVSILGGGFYEPTVLADVTPDMKVFREEIFGPVAPVVQFSSEAEAIALANDTSAGLASYIYTQNISRILRTTEALDFGMVGVNESMISTEVAPFGGVKESGVGREGSRYGIDDYLEIKYVCIRGI
ncbi:NAD-dependent succinate-semialdehyde dehydrogenase [Microbulbifer sp. HZ11]|uniref:NAD-dependent succinate-semialdehyde dehydrogenase n=1 Tax=Microbulbifer sp. HZ11 TaxID=1453501 RepID=UPI0005BA141D|nr:NAD-dependent succinate-semialdehyde dehydrogenase [Microbulbifer sp. HZ11]